MSVWKKTEQRALPTSIDPYQITARPLYNNWSGEVVTELTALAHSAVLSAVTILADSIASMPVELVRKRENELSDYQPLQYSSNQTITKICLSSCIKQCLLLRYMATPTSMHQEVQTDFPLRCEIFTPTQSRA